LAVAAIRFVGNCCSQKITPKWSQNSPRDATSDWADGGDAPDGVHQVHHHASSEHENEVGSLALNSLGYVVGYMNWFAHNWSCFQLTS
jgi:hypothetical protein